MSALDEVFSSLAPATFLWSGSAATLVYLPALCGLLATP